MERVSREAMAFPTPEYIEHANQTWGGNPVRHKVVSSGGMTLRDWFAGQALAGKLQGIGGFNPELSAQSAYLYADAMIAERERKA